MGTTGAKEKSQNHKNGNPIKTILTILFAAMFLYSAMQLYGIWQEYREGETLYHNAQEEFLQQTEEPNTPQLADARLQFAVDFESLQAVNTDVIGWIYLEDTAINYPVLHSKKNNDEYLYTTYDGKQNNSGSIFADYRNKADFTDDNTVLYGHNMKNGGMFACLLKMRGQEYYDSHREFYILTPEGNHRYEIISVFQVDALSDLYNRTFGTVEDKQHWLDRVIKNSTVLAPYTATTADRFVMLSTCVSGDDPRARVVAVGRLAEVEAVYQPQQAGI